METMIEAADVLIVEDEPLLLEGLKDGLRAALPAYQFEGVASVEAAELLLEQGLQPLVVVSDLRLPGKSGVEFLVDLRERLPEVGFILMSAFASQVPVEYSSAQQGAVRFLKKPFDLARLVEEIELALEAQQFSGQVQGITLIELLQVLNMSRRTAALRLHRGRQSGAIFIAEGEVVHAQLGEEKGIEAFNALIAWQGGGYTMESDCLPPVRTILDSFSFVLMEALRLVDETKEKTRTGEFNTLEFTKKEKCMANINEICRQLVETTPDGVASNVIDLSSGMMLGGHFLSDFTTDHFEAVSAAATNLYRGRETLRVEELVKAQRGDTSSDHFVEDVQLSTKSLMHFMVKLSGKDAILCLVLRKPGNIGMGWAAVRAAAPKVGPLVPS